MYGQDRVEEVGEADAVCLGNEPEERAVAVETPRASGLDDLQAGLVVAIENLVGHSTVGTPVDEGQRVRAVPCDADDGSQVVGQNSSDGGLGL